MDRLFISHSAEQTEQIGREIAQMLEHVRVAALEGGLGAGKTTLVRGIAAGLGSGDAVSSPTYAIVNEYRGQRSICHFDMYRLSGPDELWEIGWEDYLSSGALCLVEWGERAGDALPGSAARVIIEKTGENTREIRVII